MSTFKTGKVQMKKMRECVFGLMVICAASVDAGTVGWWRMEGSVGEEAATVPNAASPDVLPAVWNNRGTASRFSETFAPPVAGAPGNCSSAAITATDNTHASRFEVTDDSGHSLRPSSFTLEAFFKWDVSKPLNSSGTAGIVGYVRDDVISCGYGLGLFGQSVRARFNDGEEKTLDAVIDLTDGKWHHLALTFDGDSKEAKLWVDYRLSGSLTLAAAISYVDGKPFCIGCFGGRGMLGWVDEVRLSDMVLEPDDFLDARLPSRHLLGAEEPAETLFRYRLGDAVALPEGYVGSESTCGWCAALRSDTTKLNLANWACGVLESTIPEKDPAFRDGTVPCPLIRYSAEKPEDFADARFASFANAGAFKFQLDDKDQIRGGDFTAEFFMRASARQNYVGLLRQLRETTDETEFSWQIGLFSGGGLVFSVNDDVQSHYDFGVEYADGLWHHVAAVYRADARTVELYFDGRQVKSLDLTKALAEVAGGTTVLIGRMANGFDGDIDEVRITARALGPSEFLAASALSVHYGFDGDWNPVQVAGTGAETATHFAHADGNDPAFSADGLAGRYLYGCHTNLSAESFWSTNANFVSIDRGQITMLSETNGYLRTPQTTAEAFVRFPAASVMNQYSDVLALDDGAQRVWTVRVDSGNRIYVLFNGTSTVFHPSGETKTLNDGQWHHIALTLRESDAEARTDIELFVDYESYAAETVTSRIPYQVGQPLQLHASSNNSSRFQRFDIDEVRYTTRVKEPGDFIGFGRHFIRQGMILIFR